MIGLVDIMNGEKHGFFAQCKSEKAATYSISVKVRFYPSHQDLNTMFAELRLTKEILKEFSDQYEEHLSTKEKEFFDTILDLRKPIRHEGQDEEDKENAENAFKKGTHALNMIKWDQIKAEHEKIKKSALESNSHLPKISERAYQSRPHRLS